MELYVLTYVEETLHEGGYSSLVGVFDNLTDVITEAKKLNFNEYNRGTGNYKEGFYDPARDKFAYIEYLHLQRVSLNEPVEEEE